MWNSRHAHKKLVLKEVINLFRQKLIVIFVLVALIAPIGAYIYQFGIGFWTTSSEWSEFGGYIGGIYTPILTVLTLLVLSVQIYIQLIQHRQTLVVHQEKLLDDYIQEINRELDKIISESLTLRNYLNLTFRDQDMNTIPQMDGSVLFGINEKHHKLFSMWSGAMGCLKSIKGYSSFKKLESAHYILHKNRLIAYLDPQVCRTLDKYNYALIIHMEHQGIAIKHDVTQYEFWDYSAGK